MSGIDWRRIGLFLLYFSGISVFVWPNYRAILLWFVGGLLSFLFGYVDRMLYVYVTRPEESLSLAVQHLIKARHYQAALRLLRHRGYEQRRLMGKSVVFMAAFIPFGFYVLTSTGSLLAIGLLLGIGLHLLIDIGRLRTNREALVQQLFWPIKRTISEIELKSVVGIYILVFLLFSVSMIR
jgi:hypothetical protein